MGKHEEALECYEKALKIAPEKAEYLNNKANALSELEKHDEAILIYNQAILANPKLIENYINKGSTLIT
jgi:tetratricopeptide (TPR) repeat protein